MNHQSIIEAVDKSINEICNEFQSHSTLFFTENDLVCYFYSILQQRLSNSNVYDKDGHKHSLIHMEYPTPFRCNMRENKFELKKDEERTENGIKYRRGHYDIVVLNPDFIKQHSYEVIKAQNYELYKEQVLSKIDSFKPVILYGLEFMYRRDPLKLSKGEDKERAVDEFAAKIIQDTEKLLVSKNQSEFMKHVKMLTFVKGSSKEIRDLLAKKLSKRNEIIICFDD